MSENRALTRIFGTKIGRDRLEEDFIMWRFNIFRLDSPERGLCLPRLTTRLVDNFTTDVDEKVL